MRGMVTTYFRNQTYGFITADEDGVSRFFHASNYTGTPKVGTRVEFALAEPTKVGKDKQCVNIVAETPLEAATAPDAITAAVAASSPSAVMEKGGKDGAQ